MDLDLATGTTLLVLGHGAGGGIDAPDLVAVRDSCLAAGVSVGRVTQPYRLAGLKAPPAAATLDASWRAVLQVVGQLPQARGLAIIAGGRSSGARVACRCSDEAVIAVLALAFPVHPPGKPKKARTAELEAVRRPVLVIQGDRDPFGQPPTGPDRQIHRVRGDHSLRQSASQVGELAAGWITALAAG